MVLTLHEHAEASSTHYVRVVAGPGAPALPADDVANQQERALR